MLAKLVASAHAHLATFHRVLLCSLLFLSFVVDVVFFLSSLLPSVSILVIGIVVGIAVALNYHHTTKKQPEPKEKKIIFMVNSGRETTNVQCNDASSNDSRKHTELSESHVFMLSFARHYF